MVIIVFESGPLCQVPAQAEREAGAVNEPQDELEHPRAGLGWGDGTKARRRKGTQSITANERREERTAL